MIEWQKIQFLNNDEILLLDASMNFKDMYKVIKEKKPKIITFDYISHDILNKKYFWWILDIFLLINFTMYI